jgi:regulatory protein
MHHGPAMIITSIERKRGRRGRVDVYVDGVLRFDIARDSASKRSLRPGRPIADDEIAALIIEDAKRTALDTAVAMLARRPRSERELRRRLAQRKCDPALINETMELLRVRGLIDDAEFARSWAESRDRSSPRGRRLIAAELRAHGIEHTIAADAVAAVDEHEAAYRVAQKRLRSLETADDRAFRDRLGAHLQRRGFAWDTVRATVQRCLADRSTPGALDVLTEGIE